MRQADGSRHKLQSLGLGDTAPPEMTGGIHSQKTVSVTSVGDAVVLGRHDKDIEQIKMVAPSQPSQLVLALVVHWPRP
jgi:hypothetical protein